MQDEEDTEEQGHEEEKPGFLRRFIFGAGRIKYTPAAASRSTPSLGRSILRPSQPRRGTTIEFDYSQPAEQSVEDELAGEKARRKRRRTEEKARWGGLELCDEEVHGGFGMGSQGDEYGAKMSEKRSGRLLAGSAASPPRKTRTPSQQYEQDVTLAVYDDERSSAEPSTLDSSASPDDLASHAPSDQRYSTARSRARATSVEASPSTASWTSSTADTLQAQLVPQALIKRKPVILVPDSDPPSAGEEDETFESEEAEDERELDELVEKLGGKGVGVDDSGFAEAEQFGEEDERMLDAQEEDEEKPAPTVLAAIDLTTASSSPVAVRRIPARTSSSHDSTTSPSSEDDVKPFGVGSRGDSSAAAAGRPLGPSDSAILMPPPAARFKRLRRGAPPSRESQGSSDSPEGDSQVKASMKKRPRVLVEETQPGFVPYNPTTTRPDALSLENLCEDTQYPEYAPLPLPHPDADFSPAKLDLVTPLALPTPRHLSSPIRPITAPGPSPWKERVDVAWVGARPPSPDPPRQSRLGEFFARQGGVADDEVVQDSQVAGGEDEGEVRALERALVETRERMKWWTASRSRTSTPAKAQPAQIDEGDDIGDLDAEQIDEIPDSDPEDDASCLPLEAARSASPSALDAVPSSPRAGRQGTASPLGTPVKARFPRYSPGKLRSAVEKWEEREKKVSSVGEAVQRVEDVKEDEQQKGEGGGETQWESYWSCPSSSPDPLLLTSTCAADVAAAPGHIRAHSPLPVIQLEPHHRALIDEILADKARREAERRARSTTGDGNGDIPEGYRKNEQGELEIDADRFNVDALMGPADGEETWGDTLTGW